MDKSSKANDFFQFLNSFVKSTVDSSQLREEVFYVYYNLKLFADFFWNRNDEDKKLICISQSPFPNFYLINEWVNSLRKDNIIKVETHHFLDLKKAINLGLAEVNDEWYPTDPFYLVNKKDARLVSYYEQFLYLFEKEKDCNLVDAEMEDFVVQLQFLSWLKKISDNGLYDISAFDEIDLIEFKKNISKKVNEIENFIQHSTHKQNSHPDLKMLIENGDLSESKLNEITIENHLGIFKDEKSLSNSEYLKLKGLLYDYFNGKEIGNIIIEPKGRKKCRLAYALNSIHDECGKDNKFEIIKFMNFLIKHISYYKDEIFEEKTYYNSRLFRMMRNKPTNKNSKN